MGRRPGRSISAELQHRDLQPGAEADVEAHRADATIDGELSMSFLISAANVRRQFSPIVLAN